MNKFKSFFISYDFAIAALSGICIYLFMPEWQRMSFIIAYTEIIITTISIIFSLVFAACSIILSSSDDDFINFLNEEDDFDNLLWVFKITLIALFVSLIYAFVIYTVDMLITEDINFGEVYYQHKIIFASLTTVTLYSLIATIGSVDHTLNFSKYRSIFLKKKNQK